MASTVEGCCLIEERIIKSIREIRNSKKRPDKNSICLYLKKKFDIERREFVEGVLRQMEEEGTILCRIYDGNRESYFVSDNILNTKNEDLNNDFQNLRLNEFSPASTLVSSFFEGGIQTENDLSNTLNESQNNFEKRLQFLTNLVYEQQRAYNELFDNYKEERARNIQISKKILQLSVENSQLLTQKNEILRDQDIYTQNIASQKNIAIQTDRIISFDNPSENTAPFVKNTVSPQNIDLESNISPKNLENDIKSLREEKHREFLVLTSAKQKHQTASELNSKSAPAIAISPAVLAVKANPAPNNSKKTQVEANIVKPPRNKPHQWNDGVTLIVGDSTIGGLVGPKMGAVGEVKVKSHGGATTRDMYDHLEAHLSKKPTRLVIHVGTNDTEDKASDEIMKELTDLDTWVTNYTKGHIRPIFSMPTIRQDKAKPTLTIKHLQTKFRNSNLLYIDNENIQKEHLSKRQLHLNDIGTKLLASNIINYLKY